MKSTNKYQEALHNLRQIEQERNTWDISCDVLQELIDRATPLKPTEKLIEVYYRETPLHYYCPICDYWVGDESEQQNYCLNCGQAIDWSEN